MNAAAGRDIRLLLLGGKPHDECVDRPPVRDALAPAGAGAKPLTSMIGIGRRVQAAVSVTRANSALRGDLAGNVPNFFVRIAATRSD